MSWPACHCPAPILGWPGALAGPASQCPPVSLLPSRMRCTWSGGLFPSRSSCRSCGATGGRGSIVSQVPHRKAGRMEREMPDSQIAALSWRKSSASASGDCVEVADSSSSILVRDSKHKYLSVLEFTYLEWQQFLVGVRGGEFSLDRLRESRPKNLRSIGCCGVVAGPAERSPTAVLPGEVGAAPCRPSHRGEHQRSSGGGVAGAGACPPGASSSAASALCRMLSVSASEV
jgi:Domain of unknown function (DUF397)